MMDVGIMTNDNFDRMANFPIPCKAAHIGDYTRVDSVLVRLRISYIDPPEGGILITK